MGNALADLGVTEVFGVVGSGNFHVTNALTASGARFTAARHECAAVSMADGFARVTRSLGVATLHQGPGLTNAMTAIAEAAKARTPLLVLAADTSAGAVTSNFRIDQAGLAGAVGAVPERVRSVESAAVDLLRAYVTGVEQRRTVLLSLPLDVQAAECGPLELRLPSPTTPAPPARDEVVRVAELLSACERPVIIAGRGAVLSNARDALEKLGAIIGALFATSANANGFFADSEWSLGISGGFASPTAARLLTSADLVMAFGASLNMWTTRHGELVPPGATVVQIDIESGAIGRHARADASLIADARVAAERLCAELGRRTPRGAGFRSGDTAAAIAAGAWRKQTFDDASDGTLVDPRAASIALEEHLPAERTVVVDSGHFMGWPPMYLAVPDAAGFVFTQSFQSIGLGLGSAIGAAVARPDRLTVACLGDGGAFMAAGEFETAVRLGLPMLIVVYNDSAYGAEVHHFGPHGHPLDTVLFPDVDIAGFARALGARAATIRKVEDLDAVGDWVAHRDGPFVADIKVVPGVVAEWLEEAFKAH